MSEIKVEIANIQECLKTLQQINPNSCNQTELTENEALLETLLQRVSQSLLICKSYLKSSGNQKDIAVFKKVQEIMGLWNDNYSAVKGHITDTKKRLLQHLNLNDKDIDRILDAGQEMTVISAVHQMEDLTNLEDIIANIDDRHSEILKLERNIHEVFELFKDLSLLIDTQGSQIDSIDIHISKSGDFTKAGQVEIVKAEVYHNKARKYQCCCFAILIIILAIVLITLKNLRLL